MVEAGNGIVGSHVDCQIFDAVRVESFYPFEPVLATCCYTYTETVAGEIDGNASAQARRCAYNYDSFHFTGLF